MLCSKKKIKFKNIIIKMNSNIINFMTDVINDDFQDENYENSINFLMSQVKLVETKIKYNDARLKLAEESEVNQNKISTIIEVYEILIPYLKEKHIISKILDLKFEMETIELREICHKIYNKYIQISKSYSEQSIFNEENDYDVELDRLLDTIDTIDSE